MSDDRPLQRDRERTRRLILDTAEQVITARGAQVSLADIATAAGITKGGLMHHFKTRDELLAALVEDSSTRIWDEVRAQIDLTDTRPGRFCRAYVRAMTGDSAYVARVYSPTGLIARIGIEPGLDHLDNTVPDDPAHWDAAFDSDGLPPARAAAIRFAADGLAMSMNTPYLDDERLVAVRRELLALTETDDGR